MLEYKQTAELTCDICKFKIQLLHVTIYPGMIPMLAEPPQDWMSFTKEGKTHYVCPDHEIIIKDKELV